MECLLLDYVDIAQADAPYESREGGYQVSSEPASEIIQDNCWKDVSDQYLDALSQASGLTNWCDRDWSILKPMERLRYGWERFCHTVRHRLRYSFAWEDGDEDVGHPDYIDPREMLETLGEFVDSHELITTIPAGEMILRVRIHATDTYNAPSELGAPPHEYAKANRMSPAGITMLYGASNAETALAETWDGTVEAKASIGTFRLKRAVRIIDFDQVPVIPSYWSLEERSNYHALGFLHDFARELSAPVERNSLVDLPYAPTQIVSEFLTKGRYPPAEFDDPDGFNYPVHGLAFSSSRAGGRNVALNLVHDEDESLGFKQSEYLELANVVHRTLVPAST